jgi:hypothetical protein
MVIAMARPTTSTRTRRAAATFATPEDEAIWLGFVNDPGIDAWIRETFRLQWGWDKDRKVGQRYDSVVVTAWCKLRRCVKYSRQCGPPDHLAASVIAKAPRAERGRERRWRRKMHSADAMRADPRQDQSWQRDLSGPEQVAREQMREDVREALAFATGAHRQWAEMFLAICEEHDSPVSHYDPSRPDPITETKRRLGWKRCACDKFRACLKRNRHLGRLAAMRPRP